MKNYFTLFELEEKFNIDVNLLEIKYLEFQNKYHPDKTSSKDQLKIIEINEAYKILNDDFLRACYLLKLKNIDLINDDFAIKPDKSMLLEVLELQEHISSLENKTIIDNLIRQIKQTINDLIADFARAYNDNQIKHSANFLIKAKYLKKAVDDLKIKKQKLL
jgi:Fe-S protein assembly co-chaperone HscB